MTISRIPIGVTAEGDDTSLDPGKLTERAVALPGVVWAVSYWPSDDGQSCKVAAQSGNLPPILEDFELPLDRLPPPVVRALLNDSVEQGRFSVLWLQEETSEEVTEEDLSLLKGLTVIPLRISPSQSVLLLLGTEARNPDISPFREFRARTEGRFTSVDGPTEAESEYLRSEALQLEFRLLSKDVSLFKARLAMELARAQRYLRNLSMITFTVEDVPGHAMENALSELAAALRRQLRLSDLVGRASHNTIAVVLPEANESHALWVGPRLTAVAHESLASSGWRANVTVGLGARPHPNESPEAFIQRSMSTLIWSE